MTARFWSAFCLIVVAACARLLPHPANMTPMIAMALFSGAAFQRKTLAILIPLAAMLLSDLALGFHDQMVSVYGTLILISFLGFALSRKQGALRVACASVASSLLFFVVTNLTVWISSGMYPKTASGLIECYVMALPFLRNGLVADLGYSAVLFGVWALVVRRLNESSGHRENLRTI